MSNPNAARTAARADLCRLLAACYYQPGPEFVEEDAFGSMQAAAIQLSTGMVPSVQAMARSFASQSLEELLVDYTRLFLNPTGPLAAPYESFWLGEKDPTRTQQVTQTVTTTYGEGGFELSDEFRDLPDHIAAELEYLYTLIFNEARADASNDAAGKSKASEMRKRFVAAHLGRWVGPFAAAVGSAAETSYYRTLAALTERFVALEAT